MSSAAATATAPSWAQLVASAPGAFAQLSHGRVHYRLLGAASDKPLVVAVHGISAEGDAWLFLAQPLLACGCQILLPDLLCVLWPYFGVRWFGCRTAATLV